jgi:hypothetical protein
LAVCTIFYLILFFLYREEIYCDNKTESAIAGGNKIPAAVRSGEQMDIRGGQNYNFRPGGRGMGCRDKYVTALDPS